MTRKAIWFSRHQPTAEQLTDAARLGYEITAIDTGRQLGAMELKNTGDVFAVCTALMAQVSRENASAIFGVWPNDIQAQFVRTAEDAIQRGGWAADDVPCFGASNNLRSVDGGKPTFTHREWKLVGRLSQASLRWLKA